MSQHSVAEAKNHLSDLIDRSLTGETVVITRHGHAVVELRPLQLTPRRVTREELDLLAAKVVDACPSTDAGMLVSRMRDEGIG